MRIYEIDAGTRTSIDGFTEALHLIQANCKQALSAMTSANRFLYRGTRGAPSEVFHGASRQDRNPSSSTKEFQENIDSALSMAGFKALRSNSIFCSGDIMEAVGYGGNKNLYMIFPIDGFQYTWSPKIRDLFVDEYNLWGDDPGAFDKRTTFYREPNAPDELKKEFLQRVGYKNTDLDAAIVSGREIMISGEYYAVYAKYKDWPEVRALINL